MLEPIGPTNWEMHRPSFNTLKDFFYVRNDSDPPRQVTSLRCQWLQTRYTDQDIVLTIRKSSERLATLFAGNGANCGAFLTAYFALSLALRPAKAISLTLTRMQLSGLVPMQLHNASCCVKRLLGLNEGYLRAYRFHMEKLRISIEFKPSTRWNTAYSKQIKSCTMENLRMTYWYETRTYNHAPQWLEKCQTQSSPWSS